MLRISFNKDLIVKILGYLLLILLVISLYVASIDSKYEHLMILCILSVAAIRTSLLEKKYFSIICILIGIISMLFFIKEIISFL